MIGLFFQGALASFGAAGRVTKLITIAVLLASQATAYGVWHHRVFQSGVDYAIAGVARADAKIVGRATEARKKFWVKLKSLGMKTRYIRILEVVEVN